MPYGLVAIPEMMGSMNIEGGLMKTWLISLPLLCAVNVAMAQDVEKEKAAAPAEAVAAPEKSQGEDRTAVRKTKQRQGGDLRHCLALKTNKEIIRCTEKKRRK